MQNHRPFLSYNDPGQLLTFDASQQQHNSITRALGLDDRNEAVGRLRSRVARRIPRLILGLSPTQREAPARGAGSRCRSSAILIARSQSSPGYFLGAAMALILLWEESLDQTRSTPLTVGATRGRCCGPTVTRNHWAPRTPIFKRIPVTWA